MQPRATAWLRTALIASLFLTACDTDTLAPFEPEVTSATDNFQLQATGVTAVTHSWSYAWQNTGTRASVDHATTTGGGTTRLVIRDAAGTVLYDKALMPSLNEPTTAGVAGTWQIQMTLTSYSGTLNFRAQKL